MPVIRSKTALAAFRSHWTGERVLELLELHGGRLQIDWAIGVGKSSNMDAVIEAAVRGDRYDLVIVLVPTRQLIAVRHWIQHPPRDIPIVDLQPRPQKRCGPQQNQLWQKFERQGLGALGRVELCGPCSKRQHCPWPDQLGKQLEGAQVIYATQSHLERTPTFTFQLQQWVQAKRVLVILDEVNIIMDSQRRRIDYTELTHFIEVLQTSQSCRGQPTHERWRYLCQLLLSAPTQDLRCTEWRMPGISPQWAYGIQAKGWEQFGEDFRFLGYELTLFGCSPLESRERDEQGNLYFSAPLALKHDLLLYSASAHPTLTAYRLGRGFGRPFVNTRFEHPKTRWYNLASRLGTRRHFPQNAPQILDFFAQLFAQRLDKRQRILGIAKKRFLPLCARELEKRLHALGFPQVQVIAAPDAVEPRNPWLIPLISYGAIGTNSYEHFDCAYCLTGFYIDDATLHGALQDVYASDLTVPLKISIQGRPPRRVAGTARVQDRVYEVHSLAQAALDYLEMGCVLQAVGRVRPYTRPREIITFQCAAHPLQQYTQEFLNLEEARRHFGIQAQRQRQKAATHRQVLTAKQQGLTQAATATILGKSVRTIQRYWHKKQPDTSPNENNSIGLVSSPGEER